MCTKSPTYQGHPSFDVVLHSLRNQVTLLVLLGKFPIECWKWYGIASFSERSAVLVCEGKNSRKRRRLTKEAPSFEGYLPGVCVLEKPTAWWTYSQRRRGGRAEGWDNWEIISFTLALRKGRLITVKVNQHEKRQPLSEYGSVSCLCNTMNSKPMKILWNNSL